MRRIEMTGMALSVAVGLVLVLGGCSKNKRKDEEPTASKQTKKKEKKKKKTKTVTLYQYRFNPNTLTIDKGTKVTFKNKDQEVHNVKIAALDVDHNIEPNQKWSYKFKTTGEFAVENRMSEKQMKMTIIVKK